MVNIYKTIHKGWEGQVSVDYFYFFIDSFSDLPSDAMAFSTETDKYKIATGSTAIDVNSCKIYVFTASEVWHIWTPSGSGSGFEPTELQLQAMDSGINSAKVAQIQTNKEDIAAIQATIGDINSILEEVL